MDKISRENRSRNMKRIKSINTLPELKVRKLLFKLGYRYRLHSKSLPGKPDIVFNQRKKLIFVHGCFWHQHDDKDCSMVHIPKSSIDYWLPKLENNKKRDLINQKKLKAEGWDIYILWECRINTLMVNPNDLVDFLKY